MGCTPDSFRDYHEKKKLIDQREDFDLLPITLQLMDLLKFIGSGGHRITLTN